MKIYTHEDERGQRLSIHEKNQHNIFPSIKSDSIVKYGWTTDIFVKQLRQLSDSESYFEICTWHEQIPMAQQGFYLMHYGNDIQAAQHWGFITLPPIIIEQINTGVLTLLVVLVYESFGSISLAQWQTEFCTHLNFLGLHRHDSVKVLLGSHSPTMQKHQDQRVAWIFYPWFEAALQSQIKNSSVSTVPRDPLTTKKYRFLSLNKRPRPQRFLLTAWLEHAELAHHGYISWPLTHSRTLDTIATNALYSLGLKFFPTMERYVRENNKIIGCYPDADQYQGTDWMSSAPLYMDCDFEIVNETHHQNIGDNVFLTEKTFRAIYMGVPFLICGNPGSLELLQMLGYRTFPSVFDESYDKIMSPVMAINFIVNAVRKHTLNLLPFSAFAHDEILQATDHNQQLFLNKKHAQNLFEAVQKSYG